MKPEQILSGNVADFISMKYPRVFYRFDVGADMKLTIGQARRVKSLHKNKNKGYPDLFIAKPNKYYAGLFLELKASNSSPYKKDGSLKKSEHLEAQHEVHQILRESGYEAKFVTGLKEAIETIDEYMERV